MAGSRRYGSNGCANLRCIAGHKIAGATGGERSEYFR